MNDLLKIKDDLTKERDELLAEVVNLRENLTKATINQEETDVLKEKALETISQVFLRNFASVRVQYQCCQIFGWEVYIDPAPLITTLFHFN